MPENVVVLLQVIMIDVTLAGDNAIVIGLAAAGLPHEQRNKAIFVGIVAATVLRIIFAGLSVQLLRIVGLLFAGGILLLWVCWKVWREIRLYRRDDEDAANFLGDQSPSAEEIVATPAPPQSFAQAACQIVVADVSMSLDNVFAIAGAAREHPVVLIFGLTLSVALMGVAASFIARLLQRRRWIAYVGLSIILYVACGMIYRGALEIWCPPSHPFRLEVHEEKPRLIVKHVTVQRCHLDPMPEHGIHFLCGKHQNRLSLFWSAGS
jgi:YjbE family integral membrane protein